MIAAMFVAVFTLRMVARDPVEVYSMVYVLPVALAATAFGQRGGVTAAAVAVTLVATWALVQDVSLTPVGWVTRFVPIVLLGLLLGRATDRARRAEDDRRKLERTALLHRQAIEINDTLVQRMVAAKWSLEAGQTEAGLHALAVAVHEAQQLVSELIRRAEMGDHAERLSAAGEGAQAIPGAARGPQAGQL